MTHRSKRHSPQGPKNLPCAFKHGAQSGVGLRLRSVTIELGAVSVWTARVRGRQGKGDTGGKHAKEARVLAPVENPAQSAHSS